MTRCDARVSLFLGCMIRVLAFTACVPPSVSSSNAGSAEQRAALREAIESTRAGLDSALTFGDTIRIGVLTDADGELVTSDRTRHRGPYEIARVLLGSRLPRGSYGVTAARTSLELCVEGGLESGTYSITRKDASSNVGIEAGTYSLRWIINPQGARIARIALGTDRRQTDQEVGRCRRLAPVVFAQRRIEVGLSAIGLGSSGTTRALQNDLAGEGWSRSKALETGSSVSSSDWTDATKLLIAGGRKDRPVFFAAGAAVRVAPGLRVQARYQLLPQTGALITFNPDLSSRLTERYSLRETALEVLADWRGLRVGLGPALVASEWRERYERVVIDRGEYKTDYTSISDGRWRHKSAALAAEAWYNIALESSLYIGVGGHSRVGMPVRLDGVPTHQRWTATLNDLQLAFRTGVAW